LCFSLLANPSIVLVRLNFLVALLQFDSAPTPPCPSAVTGVDESALGGGLLASNGYPGVGVRSSEEDEEAVGSISARKEFGRGLE